MENEMYLEQVDYSNPFLAIKIWQIDCHDNNRLINEQQLQTMELLKQQYQWHYHPEIELLLLLEGEMLVFYHNEERKLLPGDVAILGSSEPHLTLQTKSNLRYIVLQIQLSQYWDSSTTHLMHHFNEVIRPLSNLNYIFQHNDAVRDQARQFINHIFQEMNQCETGYELAVSAYIKQILLLLLRYDTDKQLEYDDNHQMQRLMPALQYMDSHLTEKLSVKEAAQAVSMSYTYFIKMFKQTMGMSFTDFVAHKRIKKAEKLLLTCTDSIAEIAINVGLPNIGHFYERFRKYNDCSPKQYRERYLHSIKKVDNDEQ
ncbi:helix-turn-helix transcriptional regulator [Paenibacillus yanchengensis]|uniref:Helix-turn-helix transcriptional regulator n=1 Tax=Paenibacillus yanchengensis TaxID=2035833 RepID=A0ABW4YLI2_9BACL